MKNIKEQFHKICVAVEQTRAIFPRILRVKHRKLKTGKENSS